VFARYLETQKRNIYMQKNLKVIALASALAFVGCTKTASNPDLKTDEAKSSYAIGQQIGNDMAAQGVQLDVDAFSASISDALQKKKPRLSENEMREAMERMGKKVQEKQQETGKGNKEAGEKFLAENKTKKGIITTKSGLQYEVLTEGTGKMPKAEDVVSVHYRGTLLDGTEFDSSYKREKPIEFPVGGVIPGWIEALQLMKTGSKWKLYIPSDLAYGPQGQQGIPPNSVLIFEVELLKVLDKEKQDAKPAKKKK
jgi:FKBP-type peptidyl-prolyl cis-trans isomerase